MVSYKALNTISECTITDRGDGVRDGDRSQTSATTECPTTDRGDGSGDGDRR